jgi:hypothetical protein
MIKIRDRFRTLSATFKYPSRAVSKSARIGKLSQVITIRRRKYPARHYYSEEEDSNHPAAHYEDLAQHK